MSEERSALIVFARLPRPGEVKTRLGSVIGMEKAASVYDELAQKAFEAGSKLQSTGVSVYLFFDPQADEQSVRRWIGRSFIYIPQDGTTLGDRMRNAFDRTFHDGATQTAVVGTDIPGLTDVIVKEAFDLLAQNDLVIGPATDGGYYLLGMHTPAKDLFTEIPWSTNGVFSLTMSKARALGLSVGTLQELVDIDQEEDYKKHLGGKGFA
jgi:rSAM/selenodomain-associated transferase 1